MQETRGRLVELDVTADPALACLATYRAEIWCRTGGARQNGYDARARDERVANLKECDGLRSAASTRPDKRSRQQTWRTDQFGIGTLRVNAPTHSFGFWGPKLVWQITHAGWKLLRGIERR